VDSLTLTVKVSCKKLDQQGEKEAGGGDKKTNNWKSYLASITKKGRGERINVSIKSLE